MRTLTIVVVAIVAILAAPAVMADAYEDCFNFIEGKLGEKKMASPEVVALVNGCIDAKLREAERKSTNSSAGNDGVPTWGTVIKTVVLQNAPLAISGHFNRRYYGGGHLGYQFSHQLPRYVMFHDPHIGGHH